MSAKVIPMIRNRAREILTGPDMILIFWIARLALEDRDAYEFVKKELDIGGEEAARIYDEIRDFLEIGDERRKH
jgi:hypothetical protein